MKKEVVCCDCCKKQVEDGGYIKTSTRDTCLSCARNILGWYFRQDSKYKDCKKCNGSGITSSFTGKTGSIGICPNCKGSGKVPTGIPYYGAEKCGKCDGSGNIELSCGLTNKCDCETIL